MVSQRIIIKIGTSTLTSGSPNISYPQLINIIRQVAQLHSDGNQIIITSSGAIAAGKEVLNFKELPKFVPAKQMLAAIGQPRLMAIYTQIFQMYGKMVAQVLLTRADLSDRRRYINARNTLEALLMNNVIPIINENDTVATEEIRIGDNDNLSALVANLVEADLLILLTDQPGLFTGDPRKDVSVKLISEVKSQEIPDELWQAAGDTTTRLGTGGMVTKLHAADLARQGGTTVIIADGNQTDILLRIRRNEQIGTKIFPVNSKLEGRKRYMLAGVDAYRYMIKIDKGASQAIKKGGSLLPVGIIDVVGEFERGDTVKILLPNEKEIAVGLVNYNSRDIAEIKGHQSSDLEQILGYTFGDEIIHHNNMMILIGGEAK